MLERDYGTLDQWLDDAACGLVSNARARVREEVSAHYESAREDALARGVSEADAHHAAIATLGSARAANKEYRKVHVTRSVGRILAEGAWIGRVVCSRRYLLLIPAAAFCLAVMAFVRNPELHTAMIVFGAAGLCFAFGAPFYLRINTPGRGLAYRLVMWTWVGGMMVIACGPFSDENFWTHFLTLSFPWLWIVVWMEWNKRSLRRKIPKVEWPRSLYF